MRAIAPLLALSILAGCSATPEQNADRSESTAEALAPAADMAGPNVAPTAAPGVAFNYRYDFRLAADRIGQAQERHAQACEKLGIDRCRITGMRYALVDDRDISAMLAFKLEPSLARQFGKDGIAEVTKAEGMLVLSEIDGVDAGSAITAAKKAEGRLREERGRLEARLKAGGLSPSVRASIQAQLDDIAQSLESSNADREENEESLATTPMVFNYGSGEIVPGFDVRSPLRGAIETAGNLLIGGIAILIVVIGALIPFALFGALLWFGWRLIRPRIERLRGAREASPPAEG